MSSRREIVIPADLVRRARRLRLAARAAVGGLLTGDHRSRRRGAGLEPDDVRAYQPGDDVRAIDWNVTARRGSPFVKRFAADRERTVWVLHDRSASLEFASRRTATAEAAALVALAATFANDRVGLLAFTDRIERVVPPRRGRRHGLTLAAGLLAAPRPRGRGTDLAAALARLGRLQRRRALVVVVSDFLASDRERSLALAGRRHDLVAVCVTDAFERDLPRVGLLRAADAETDERILIDTTDERVRAAYRDRAEARRRELKRAAAEAGVDLVEAHTAEDFLGELARVLRWRGKARGRS